MPPLIIHDSVAQRSLVILCVFIQYNTHTAPHFYEFIYWIDQLYVTGCKELSFATNSDFILPLTLQPDAVYFWYFKRWILFENKIQTIIWTIEIIYPKVRV